MNRKQILFLAAGASTALATQALAQSDLDSARARHDQLLAETEARSSALQGDNGVNVNGQLQFRYLINSRDEVPAGEEDTAVGFQTRRTKIAVSGDANEEWSYKIQGAFSRSSGDFVLEDAYVNYDIGDGWSVQAGQFKFGVLREELVSSKRQLTAERSTTNEFFNQGRSQGVQARYATENYQVFFGFSDGIRTANSDFTSMAEADYGFNGRFEYMWAGEWSRFKDFTSWRGSEFAGMAGGAVHFQDGDSTFGTADQQILILTGDVSVEGNGWNAFGSITWSMFEDGAADIESDDIGIVAQGGYFLTDQWEVFGRYDILLADELADDDFSAITVGVNHYLITESHSGKFTGDFVFYLDEQATSLASASTGLPLLMSDSDSQFSIRLQFQLLF